MCTTCSVFIWSSVWLKSRNVWPHSVSVINLPVRMTLALNLHSSHFSHSFYAHSYCHADVVKINEVHLWNMTCFPEGIDKVRSDNTFELLQTQTLKILQKWIQPQTFDFPKYSFFLLKHLKSFSMQIRCISHMQYVYYNNSTGTNHRCAVYSTC